jgi:hypothetical protein
MKQNAASRQPDLFDVDDYQTSPIPSQKEQLAALVEALLREIAAAQGGNGCPSPAASKLGFAGASDLRLETSPCKTVFLHYCNRGGVTILCPRFHTPKSSKRGLTRFRW